MIFFDGIYRLRYGERKRRAASSADGGGAWRVRIINLSLGCPQVAHLRPFIVFASPTGEGIFKASCAESLGRSICRDFDLNPQETLWVECLPGSSGRLHVAVFIPRPSAGPDVIYRVTWRTIRPNEGKTLQKFLPENECYEGV